MSESSSENGGKIIVRVRRRTQPRQIEIRDIEEPKAANPEATIDWIFRCLGGSEDDELAKEVFREIVKTGEKGVRSKEIQEKVQEKKGVTQGAVVYHLNTYRRSGLIVKEGRYYYLKRQTLDRTLEEMEYEMLRHFQRMRKLAKLMDEFERL